MIARRRPGAMALSGAVGDPLPRYAITQQRCQYAAEERFVLLQRSQHEWVGVAEIITRGHTRFGANDVEAERQV